MNDSAYIPPSERERKWGGRWWRVTHGCERHSDHPIHECDACQQATDDETIGGSNE